MSDAINPQHYKHLPAEAIDIIEAAIAKGPSNEAAYLHGQALKYLLRCWHKKGIEDLRKAKWYLDRLVDSFDEVLAEINAPILEGESEKPKPSKDQPPSGYRMLGDAKVEPRIEGDQYWSLSANDWSPLLKYQVFYANQENWPACRKIEKPSNNPTASLNSDKIPKGYRKLNDSREEPRQLGDLRWSVSENRYVGMSSAVLEFANQENWPACRKIEERSEPPPDLSQMGVQVISELEPSKRYREPTLADLANGPIECEVGDNHEKRTLIYVFRAEPKDSRFVVVDETKTLCTERWATCRIEVQE